jgi:hypothetical protein
MEGFKGNIIYEWGGFSITMVDYRGYDGYAQIRG